MAGDDTPSKARFAPPADAATPLRAVVGDDEVDKAQFVLAAGDLFNSIASRFGKAEARHIFRTTMEPASAAPHELRWAAVADMYRQMKKPNKMELARQLLEQNKTLPPEDRYGNGDSNITAMYRYVGRAVAAGLELQFKWLIPVCNPGPRAKRRKD